MDDWFYPCLRSYVWSVGTATEKSGCASTGLILRGAEGIYHPTTNVLSVEDVSANALVATDADAVTAPADSRWYALASKSGTVGFYHVSDGVVVPQFKAYFVLPEDAQVKQYIGLDGITTDVSRLTPNNADGLWFRIDGMTSTDSRKGINIHNGQKILIK